MATSVVPALIDALFTQAAAALPSALVLDGFGVTEDPGDFLMIGIDDPLSPDAAQSARMSQIPATAGTTRSRDETGEVFCSAMSWNGNGGSSASQKQARDAAFAIVAAVETLCRTTPGLGIAGYGYVVAQVGGASDFNVKQDQNTTGAMCIVTFPVSFAARL